MNRSRFIIIGLGNIGLLLIKMLSKDFNLVCIDSNADTLDTVKALRGESLRGIKGDATSRLVLEEAGVGEADTVIITTTSEKVNLEIARVLREHFEVPRVIAVGITQTGIKQLEELGVEVESIFNVSATGLRNRLEHKTKAVQGVGLGKNEILEVEVHPHSRVANKRLSSIRPHNWRVGLIYREGNIVVPRGETVLKPKDRVIILGDPQVLQTVAEILTFRFQHFPLEYGDTLVALLQGDEKDGFFDELGYLASVFPLERVLLVHPQKNDGYLRDLEQRAEALGLRNLQLVTAAGSLLSGLDKLLTQPGLRVGLTVLSKPRLVDTFWSMFAKSKSKSFLRDLALKVRSPILLAGGSFPYEKVAVPCTDPDHVQHALETTLEMAPALNYQIDALLAVPSDYIASEEEEAGYGDMKKEISDLSYVYKTSIRAVELAGNPIRAVSGELAAYSLTVSDLAAWTDLGFLRSLVRPDVAWNIVRQSPVSTMIVPPPGELI